jgi:hypothetical protein
MCGGFCGQVEPHRLEPGRIDSAAIDLARVAVSVSPQPPRGSKRCGCSLSRRGPGSTRRTSGSGSLYSMRAEGGCGGKGRKIAAAAVKRPDMTALVMAPRLPLRLNPYPPVAGSPGSHLTT